MAWEVNYLGGLYLPQLDWWLDATAPKPRSFVSHAHFDHMANHRLSFCTEATGKLMRARRYSRRDLLAVPFGESRELVPGVRLELHPAGHIIGSAQFLAESEHGRLLYSGDFKLRPGRAAERCATPRADVLIMETTFGRPQYRLPPTAEVVASMVQFCREAVANRAVPVLLGYSLGKAQEILASLAEAELPVMLHAEVLRMTRQCEELGFTFPAYREFSPREVAGHVVIAPPQLAHGSWLKNIEPRRVAMVTGWGLDSGAKYRFRCDAVFPLSDHADYDDLLNFVDLVQPKRVLTVHGFAVDFAATLRQRGVDAVALGKANQLELKI